MNANAESASVPAAPASDRERDDLDPMLGIFIGCALSLFLWGLVAGLVLLFWS
jgi:hypothetical protein